MGGLVIAGGYGWVKVIDTQLDGSEEPPTSKKSKLRNKNLYYTLSQIQTL